MFSSIAVVGGGFVGTLLTAKLVKAFSSLTTDPLTIYFIDESKANEENESNLILLPASFLSLRPQNPRHFFNWWKKINPEIHEHSFPERGLFFQYIQDYEKDYEEGERKKIKLRKMNDEVIDLSLRLNKIKIITAKSNLEVDKVYLCLERKSLLSHLSTSTIKNSSLPIALYGRGPLLLEAITFFKKSFPGIPLIIFYNHEPLIGPTLELENNDLEKIAVDLENLRTLHHFVVFINQIKRHQNMKLSGGFMLLFKKQLGLQWKNFSIKEKRQFYRYLHKFWWVFRQLTPENLRPLLKDIPARRLSKKEMQNLGPFSAFITLSDESALLFKESRLLQNLFRKGYLCFHPSLHPFTFAISPQGQLMNRNWRHLPHITMMGSWRQGEEFNCHDIPDLIQQVDCEIENNIRDWHTQEINAHFREELR